MSLHCNSGWAINFVVHCVCAGETGNFLYHYGHSRKFPHDPSLFYISGIGCLRMIEKMFHILSSFPSFFYSFFHCFPFFQTHFSWQKDHLLLEHLPFFDWLTAVWHSQIVPVTMNVEFFCVTLIWGCCGPVLGPFLRLPLKSLVSIILL